MYKNLSRRQQSAARISALFNKKGPKIGRGSKSPLPSQSFLKEALLSKKILKGTVRNLNKGGYTIQIGDILGFCPYSHMKIKAPSDQQKIELVGKEYFFFVNEGKKTSLILTRICSKDTKQWSELIKPKTILRKKGNKKISRQL